jgi:hypothetical protein
MRAVVLSHQCRRVTWPPLPSTADRQITPKRSGLELIVTTPKQFIEAVQKLKAPDASKPKGVEAF